MNKHQSSKGRWRLVMWITLAIAATIVWWLKLSAVWLFIILMVACHLGHMGMHGASRH